MPLAPGSDPKTISANISELTHHGSRPRKHDQIVAIALSNADKHPHKAFGGMSTADPLANLAHASAVKGIGGGGGMGKSSGAMSPSQGTPWWTKAAARGIEKPMASGIGHFQAGGGMSMSEASPWTERADSRIISDIPMHSGLIGGSGAGRTDRLPLSVGNNSHVISSDVVSALGQGTTSHGGKILEGALGGGTGPYDTAIPQEIKGHGPPAAPHVSQATLNEAKGGSTHERTSILAASGEFVCSPEQVESLGNRAIAAGRAKKGESAMDAGHRLIDEMVARVRKWQINWLQHAPPPKKSAGGAVGIGLAG